MKECKFIKPLYRTENKDYIDELIDVMKNKNIDIYKLDIYLDKDSIYNLELNIKNDALKFKLIKIIKSYVRKKLLNYNGKIPLYTFLSLHIPDKALVKYKINTNNLTIYTSEMFEDKFYSYTENNINKLYDTKEEAVKECIKYTCRKAFSYITGRLYL
jgi:hypothetical protein